MSDPTDANLHGRRIFDDESRGERLTRIPRVALRRMIRDGHPDAALAEAELERRGDTAKYDIEISAHAINRASQRCLRAWRKHRQPDEGIQTWLARIAREGLIAAGERRNQIERDGIVIVFNHDGAWPLVTTVARA